MKRLLHKFSQKDNGSMVGHILPIILTAFAMAAIAVIFSSWMMNLDRKNDIDVIGRKYILKMETVGGLTPDDKEALIDELEKSGLTNIVITASEKTGNPDVDPGYGTSISLKIEGDLKVFNYQFIDLFETRLGTGTVPIVVYKVSTAKH